MSTPEDKPIGAETVVPYDTDATKTEQVEEMFDAIAPTYDFMNRAMSLGTDKSWRRRLVGMAASSKPENILDVATGTADLAISLAQATSPQTTITGVDLSEQMLNIGIQKVEKAELEGRISLEQADCMALPFDDGTFSVVTAAFGVRNFENLRRGLSEMTRVLKPGGRLLILELTVPQNPVIKPLYKLYTHGVIPLAARILTPDHRAYSYLPQSIAAMPQGASMTALMQQAGLSDATFIPLTFGAATIYSATKSPSHKKC